MARKGKPQSNGSGAHLGFEATLWAAADELRGNIDASDYEHVVRDAWARAYEDQKGFWMLAKLADIREHNHILTPNRYVGADDIEADDEPFEQKFVRLSKQLEERFSESDRLREVIRGNLARLRRPE